jgi:hypothetical protein
VHGALPITGEVKMEHDFQILVAADASELEKKVNEKLKHEDGKFDFKLHGGLTVHLVPPRMENGTSQGESRTFFIQAIVRG